MADYFPTWRRKDAGVVAPDERPAWPQALALGAQHVFAMFGAIILNAPLSRGHEDD